MIPLSYAQSRLWFLYRFSGPSANYNISAVLRLRGRLDRTALAAAVGDVVRRHDSLRTLIVEDPSGTPFQQVLPAAEVVVDVPSTAGGRPGQADVVTDTTEYPFDLATDLPVRAALVRRAPDEHLLALAIHHIAADGGSIAPFTRDLATAYAARLAGDAPDWPPLPVGYVDYTLWQRELLGDESDEESVLARQVDYWRQELDGLPQPLRLPLDRPRPAVAAYRGDVVDFTIGPELFSGVEELARRRGVTVSMVLQGALAVLLHRMGGGDDLAIGSPIAGRTDEALADMVGFFVNSWVLRLQLSRDPSFDDLLHQVREKALGAYEHQDAPFERLVELLNPDRSLAYHPFFQVMFAWQNYHRLDFALPGIHVTAEPVPAKGAKFDLFFNFAPDATEQGINGVIEYATDLFDRTTVEQLGARLRGVLRQVVRDPGRPVRSVDVYLPGERDRLLTACNATAAALPDPSVPAAFRRRSAATPDAVAVRSGRRSLTYQRLDELSDTLARNLVRRGVGGESLVGVALPRSVELVVVLLAVLKAGGAYLPLDLEYPEERVAFMLRDAAPKLVITGGQGDTLPGTVPTVSVEELHEESDAVLPVGISAGGLAYVMYTSGS
ncbi:condensation domain-containing protein, partial [Streptomyces ziwulingensis]|uniref:condensation domain-containing protein n=1 Tax=Streptomyces ziwulingensis TaxID=1045501 RepID=UPI0031EC8F5E